MPRAALTTATAACVLTLLPHAHAETTAQHAPQEKAATHAAYLGVSTRSVDPTLSTQLQLPRGVGLVVDFADPKSPAGKILRAHDVLHKLNDQILISHHQLATLIRTQKPADTVTLTLIREGKTMRKDVTLGTMQRRRDDLPAKMPHKHTFSPNTLPTHKLFPHGKGDWPLSDKDTHSYSQHTTVRSLMTDGLKVTLKTHNGSNYLSASDSEGGMALSSQIPISSASKS